MKNLTKLKSIEAGAPDAMKAFVAFDKASFAAGAIPVKYKEMMALAVAFTTQCPYCIEIHANKNVLPKRACSDQASISEVCSSPLVASDARRCGRCARHPRNQTGDSRTNSQPKLE